MKIVQPGEAIENIIINQYPVLEGLDIGPQKLKHIFETFGSKCLIIFDGLDEHELGSNDDILNVIEGKKLLHCNVLLTSRPHCISDILTHFQTVVSIKGFTEVRTKKFASCILKKKDEIETVLKFNSETLTEKGYLYSSPMLMLFICILVNSNEISLERESMSLGDIYMRLVRCLYRKFVVRKDSEFSESEFVDLLKCVGKIAWDTLQSGLGWLKAKI